MRLSVYALGVAALGFDFSSISCQCIRGWQTLSWMLDGRDKVSVHVIEAGKQALLFTGRHFWNRKCRKKTWWQQEFAVFKCEATANSVTGHVCVNSNKPAGSGRSREIPRRVRRAWTLAAGWCALMFLIQVGRLNIALDFDTLWYGVRSQYIVAGGTGLYENPGLVGMVYVYSKGFEVLTLPLCDLASHSYLTFFNLWLAVLGIGAMIGKLNDEAKIQCPFYLSKKREKLRQAITITCENIENNLGFDVKNMLSFKSIRERTDWMGLFCEDEYQNCPYYKKIYKKYEEAEAWELSRNRKKKSKEKKCR